jgi:hypothetical protein
MKNEIEAKNKIEGRQQVKIYQGHEIEVNPSIKRDVFQIMKNSAKPAAKGKMRNDSYRKNKSMIATKKCFRNMSPMKFNKKSTMVRGGSFSR